MHQTKSYWRMATLAAVAGVLSAFVGSACTVTTSTDDDGGAAGASAAGAATAGANSAGAATAGANSAGSNSAGSSSAGANTAGNAGAAATPYECDVPDVDTPAGTLYPSCAPDAEHTDDVCALCIQSSCCDAYKACYAYGPGDQCGYGGPDDAGEISCVQQCVQDGVAESGVYDATLLGTCANKCITKKANGASKDCEESIGLRTNDLIACMADNCQEKCFGG
ncbi:MAG: hypothetical protein ABW061_27015 [Polyangiaceae bacterium]